jgi:hypothetical protein
LESFLGLLILVLAVALTTVYYRGRIIRGGYAQHELQCQNRRLASLKAKLEAEMAGIYHPRFVLEQLQRFELCMTTDEQQSSTAQDLRLVQAAHGR